MRNQAIQVIERASGYVETDSGKVVRGLKSTYKRHGTLNLFAALEAGTVPLAEARGQGQPASKYNCQFTQLSTRYTVGSD
jgi:hypothetical protein